VFCGWRFENREKVEKSKIIEIDLLQSFALKLNNIFTFFLDSDIGLDIGVGGGRGRNACGRRAQVKGKDGRECQRHGLDTQPRETETIAKCEGNAHVPKYRSHVREQLVSVLLFLFILVYATPIFCRKPTSTTDTLDFLASCSFIFQPIVLY
jgi:hypothetical protein